MGADGGAVSQLLGLRGGEIALGLPVRVGRIVDDDGDQTTLAPAGLALGIGVVIGVARAGGETGRGGADTDGGEKLPAVHDGFLSVRARYSDLGRRGARPCGGQEVVSSSLEAAGGPEVPPSRWEGASGLGPGPASAVRREVPGSGSSRPAAESASSIPAPLASTSPAAGTVFVSGFEAVFFAPRRPRPPYWRLFSRTATTITAPTNTVCQYSDMPTITRPSERKPMTKAPNRVPRTLPRPPESTAPPITTAAMAVSS